MSNRTRRSINPHSIYLIGLIVINTVLTGWLLFQPVTAQLIQLAGILTLTIAVIASLQYFRLEYLLKPLIVIFSGGLGILLGCLFDFGQLGLQALSSLCIAGYYDSSFQNVTQMLSLAPWTHIGMWVSCSLALVIVDFQRGGSAACICSGVKHMFCIVGMLAGMWLVHGFPLNWLSSMLDFSAIGPVGLMWLVMSIGMLSFYVFFDAMMCLPNNLFGWAISKF
jgi:hypothetical protein